MMEYSEYTPDDFLAGNEPLKTGRAFVAAGQTFARLTPLMLQQDSGAGEDTSVLVAWDGTPGLAVAVSAKAVEALAADTLVPYYKTGCFRLGFVQWPAGLTEAEQRAAFIGTPISVDDEH
ncbi:head decoration protein [Vibrio parahaemolyticus]